MAIDVGVTFPGNPDVRQTRVQALGPMSGLLTGIKVGAIAGAVPAAGVRLLVMLAAPIIGAVAMATADLPLQRHRVSGPTTSRR